MRTTLITDPELLERARELTGIREKTALVREGLETLIARESGKRLAALGGTQPKFESGDAGGPPDGVCGYLDLGTTRPKRRARTDATAGQTAT